MSTRSILDSIVADGHIKKSKLEEYVQDMLLDLGHATPKLNRKNSEVVSVTYLEREPGRVSRTVTVSFNKLLDLLLFNCLHANFEQREVILSNNARISAKVYFIKDISGRKVSSVALTNSYINIIKKHILDFYSTDSVL